MKKRIVEENKKKVVSHCSTFFSGKTLFFRSVFKKQWVHHGYRGNGNNALCTCGKIASHDRIKFTMILNNVNCPRCIESLKNKYWHCKIHGFIDDVHVTNDEKCELCGEAL